MIRTVSAALPRIALVLLALVPVVTVFFILQSMASGALRVSVLVKRHLVSIPGRF